MIKKFLGQQGLTNRIANASVWTTLGFGVNTGLRLVSNLILTRLLSPEIFGLMALAQVFLGGVRMLSDVGDKTSVIRSKKGDDPTFLQTAWTVQILRSWFIAVVCWIIAWPLAHAYNEPDLAPLICVLTVSSIVFGFNSISEAVANRKLKIESLTKLTIFVRIMTTAVTIAAAWMLQSVWGLAIGIIFGSVLQVVLSHYYLPPFQHRFRLERSAVSEIFHFGKWIILATLFTYVGGMGQQAMTGLLVPTEVIGLIAIATLLASVPNHLFNQLMITVLLPSLSELYRERPQDIPKALARVRIALIFGAFPVLFVIALAAEPIIDFLYDERYESAWVILSLTALNGAVPLLSKAYQNLLLAEGRSDLHALLMFLWAATTAAGIFLGFYMFGLIGSIVGVGIAASVMFFANAAFAAIRGYSTFLPDLLAFGVIFALYVYVLTTLDAPAAFYAPELVGDIFQPST